MTGVSRGGAEIAQNPVKLKKRSLFLRCASARPTFFAHARKRALTCQFVVASLNSTRFRSAPGEGGVPEDVGNLPFFPGPRPDDVEGVPSLVDDVEGWTCFVDEVAGCPGFVDEVVGWPCLAPDACSLRGLLARGGAWRFAL